MLMPAVVRFEIWDVLIAPIWALDNALISAVDRDCTCSAVSEITCGLLRAPICSSVNLLT